MIRNKSIDIAKGIGMLLVVLGHAPAIPSTLSKVIYSFHMPLFFFISGFLYNTEKYNQMSFSNFIRSRFFRYLVPYFFFGVISLFLFGVIYPLARDGYSAEIWKNALKYAFGLLYSRGSPDWMVWSVPLWFLTCIFISEMILYFVLKHFNRHFLIFLVTGILGYGYSVFVHFKLPWNIDVALVAVCFMYTGNVFKQQGLLEILSKKIYLATILVILVISIIFNSKVDLNERIYGNIILTFFSGVCGTIAILAVTRKCKALNILEFFGRNSLLMMGTTYAVLNTGEILSETFHVLNNFILNFSFQVLVLTILSMLLNQIKLVKRILEPKEIVAFHKSSIP